MATEKIAGQVSVTIDLVQSISTAFRYYLLIASAKKDLAWTKTGNYVTILTSAC